MEDMENLSYARKYRPNTLAKYIGNEKVKETALKALNNGTRRPQVILLWGDSGCGKAQPLDSLVLTVNGYKKMGDIQVGDEVFTHTGARGRVSGIYPQGVRPIYKICLSDKTHIKVSDEHLNSIYTFNSDGTREDYTITTTNLISMFKKGERLYIDTVKVDNAYDMSVSERADYLRGIFKSNGLANGDSFTISLLDSEELKKVTGVLRSLGVVVTLKGDKIIGRMNEKRYIESIERVEDQQCQCIMVNHSDHTYISDDFIPTHNTTFARLLAKEYSCESRTDEGACGVCLSCQTIDDYIATGNTDILTNIQEVDITDQSGKKDLDAVLDDMLIPSFGDEWKIYIFDEVHMATTGLQNRLLKIAEEPPENVLMILCTTNPEKLIDTLKNRCQLSLHVTKPKVKELAGLLRYVCETEGVEYDNKGLEFIANRSDLTIRTSLMSLDQVVMEQNSAKYENVTQVFEAVSNTLMVDIFKALKNKDTLRYVTLLYDIKSKMDFNVFLTELKGFVVRGIYTINGIKMDGVSDAELIIYRRLFGDLGIEKITGLLTKLLSLDSSDLETQLIALGYTGFDSGVDSPKKESRIVDFSEIDNELAKEVAMQNKVIKEREDIDKEKGIENASNIFKTANIDDLLSLGASLVK